MTSAGRYHVRSVLRALDLLRALAEAPKGAANLMSLSREAALHPSTAYRLLESLAARDFVRITGDGSYTVGPAAFEVGSVFLRGSSVWSHAGDLAEEMALATNETGSIGVLHGNEVLYIAIAHGQSEIGIQSFPGTRQPAHCTALGKVLLASLPRTELVRTLHDEDLPALTPNTLTSISDLERELERVAEQGFSVDNEERLVGIRAVAAPIGNHAGEVVAAISASGPAFRLQGERFDVVRRAVLDIAQNATRRLGGGIPAAERSS